MSWLRILAVKIRAVVGWKRVEREFEEELRAHFEALVEQNVQRGMAAEEARRTARHELGGADQIKEAVHDQRGLPLLESVIADVRYAARMLRKSPGFTTVAVLTLALGIGANTAIFSVVNAVLLRPLPYKEADRIVYLSGVGLETENFAEWKQQSKSYDLLAAASIDEAELTGSGEAQRLRKDEVSADYFRLWGIQPAVGRGLVESDFRPGTGHVAVISDRLWRNSLKADAGAIGRTVLLNRQPYTVIGVMPAGIGPFPDRNIDVWTPLLPGRSKGTEALGRLRAGVSFEQARAEALTDAEQLARQWARDSGEPLIGVLPLRDQLVEDSRTSLVLLSGAVGFVLLIVCANVANLLLAGLTGRRREIGIRIALGASRGRIVRQLLVEGFLLSTMGAGFGLLAAHWATRILVSNVPYYVPRIDQSRIDAATLAFTLLLSGIAALVFTIPPAFAMSAPDLNTTLKEGAKSQTGSPGHQRLRAAFIVSELALVMVVLVGTSLLIKAFVVLRPSSPGFDPSYKLTMNVVCPCATTPQAINFFRTASERIGSLPGVRGVAAVSYLPMAGVGFLPDISIDGKVVAGIFQGIRVHYQACTPNYLRLMHMAVVSGRDFAAGDDERAPKVAIINEMMAQNLWPNKNPIGRQVTLGWHDESTEYTVVGIVRDHRIIDTSTASRPEIYVPFWQDPASRMTVVIHTWKDSGSVMPAARAALESLDRDTVISDVQTMQEVLDEAVAHPRYNAELFGVLGGLALMLAIVGIYGVISYGVTQRTHEIGVRMALGAQPGDVIGMIVGEGLALAFAGIAIGMVAALGLTRLLESVLYEVKPSDPATFIAVVVVLASVAAVASYIPARRAMRVDPMVALRHE